MKNAMRVVLSLMTAMVACAAVQNPKPAPKTNPSVPVMADGFPVESKPEISAQPTTRR